MRPWPGHRIRDCWGRLGSGTGLIATAIGVLLLVPQVGASSAGGASIVPVCSAHVLQVSVVFNGPGKPFGAMTFVNNSSHACSLSGQPSIRVLDRAGRQLKLSESPYHWSPSLPRPVGPVVMTPAMPWSIVEFNWCGFKSGYNRIEIRFQGWTQSLEEMSSSFTPTSFDPPACVESSASRFAVDYVRKLGSKGITGRTPILHVTPSNNLHSGEKVVVTVSGFDIGGKFFLSECAKEADVSAGGCGEQLAAQPFGVLDMTGAGTYSFVLRTRAATRPYSTSPTVPCQNACMLMATGGFSSSFASAPLRFAAS